MKDQFEREIDYIRISVTDRCNLRCRYCMPSCGVPSCGHDAVLRFDEMVRLVRLFCSNGIRHVKITGGEPLVRKGLPSLIRELKKLPGLETVSLTTNGLLLSAMLPELMDAGLDAVNISLDTLREDRYAEITGQAALPQVLKALDDCCLQPGLRVKLNAVTLADYNEDEVEELAVLARDRQMDVRFIEMMPMGLGRNFSGYRQDQILARLEAAYGPGSKSTEKRGNGPAVYYDFRGFIGKVGFISALSHRFCESCNRVRLTSEGLLKPCLQYAEGVDLRSLLRSGADDDTLTKSIRTGIFRKPRQHGFCVETAECGDPGTGGEPAEVRQKEEGLMSGIGG